MDWFSGNIPEAISSSRAHNSVFVVFVSDSSEASTTTITTLDTAAASLSKHVVAIKFSSTSEEAKQFSQIFPVVIVPSVYFINPSTGMPVEILGGALTPETLQEKLASILTAGKDMSAISSSSNVAATSKDSAPRDDSSKEVEVNNESKEVNIETKPEASQICNVNSETSTSSTIKSESCPSSSESKANTIETELRQEPTEAVGAASTDNTCSASTSRGTESSTIVTTDGDEATSVTLEERVSRAKQLVEQAQLQKQEEQKQKEVSDEMQRRNTGKDMRRVKHDQEEKERRDMAKERRKEKEDDRIARERVKAQIAADREDREARAALLRGDAAPAPPPAAAPTAQPTQGDCRLKLRLPDGSSVLVIFKSSSTLAEVHRHVQDNVVTGERFRLASTLRAFQETDMTQTLCQLGLMPSAILLILVEKTGGSNKGGPVSAASSSLLSTLFWLLTAPLQAVYSFISRALGREGTASSTSSSPASAASTSAAGTGTSSRRRTDRPKTAYGSRSGARYRREGNVHRLGQAGDTDTDEDNNTWNGNSTQQM